MAAQVLREEDFPPGHPKRHDHDPDSPEAIEWQRLHVHEQGEPAYHANHPYTLNPELNQIEWKPGVDPFHPEREAFTGRELKPANEAEKTEE